MEQITLYFKQGSSDKVYQAAIEPRGDQFVVTFAFGRRGTTLQTGTKTSSPVGYNEAKVIYDKLITEKTAKGYTPGQNGTPYQHTEKANEVSGINCQLLNPIDQCEVVPLINNRAWCLQEKFDGKRMLIQKDGPAVHGINRNGLISGIPSVLVKEIRAIDEDFILDGECIGDDFMVFDLLVSSGEDIRQRSYQDRYMELLKLTTVPWLQHIHFAETTFDTASKAAMLERLRKGNKEGVVFKKCSAPYVAGRPSTGGDQLKYKFYETASFIVGKANGKRSVSLKLFDGTDLVSAGNVTIPPNHAVPQASVVVEVRYLYAFKESGSVYQPVYLGVRDDVPPVACKVNQLKFKAEPQTEVARC